MSSGFGVNRPTAGNAFQNGDVEVFNDCNNRLRRLFETAAFPPTPWLDRVVATAAAGAEKLIQIQPGVHSMENDVDTMKTNNRRLELVLKKRVELEKCLEKNPDVHHEDTYYTAESGEDDKENSKVGVPLKDGRRRTKAAVSSRQRKRKPTNRRVVNSSDDDPQDNTYLPKNLRRNPTRQARLNSQFVTQAETSDSEHDLRLENRNHGLLTCEVCSKDFKNQIDLLAHKNKCGQIDNHKTVPGRDNDQKRR